MKKINNWLNQNYLFILVNIFIYMIVLFYWYYRTGYFKDSLSTQETTFYTKIDTVTTNKFYKDMSNNYILLDRKKVIIEKEVLYMSISTEKGNLLILNKEYFTIEEPKTD